MASPGRKLLKGKRFDNSWFSVCVILFLHPQYTTERFHVRGWGQGIINTQCYFRSGPEFFFFTPNVYNFKGQTFNEKLHPSVCSMITREFCNYEVAEREEGGTIHKKNALELTKEALE